MKQTVPFKKDIILKTKIAEVINISLENDLKMIEDNMLSGDFSLTGEYKITESSLNTEKFAFKLPFDIAIDENYNTEKVDIEINDFYYEIINNDVLRINIEVCLDNLKKKEIIKEEKEILIEKEEKENLKEEIILKKKDEIVNKIEKGKNTNERNNNEKKENVEEIKSLFDSFDESNETFSTYRIYIIKKEDTIEKILKKYNITSEEISSYNNIKDIKAGDKLIIPTINNE